MADDPSKFGEAYVELRMKLDEFDRQVEASEKRMTEAIERLEARGRSASETFKNIGQGFGGFAQAAEPVTKVALRFGLLSAATIAVRRNMLRAGTAAGMAGRMLSAFSPIGVVVVLGDLIRLIRAIPEAARNFWDWLRSPMDIRQTFENMTVSIDGFMRRVPILGSMWTGVARTISEVSELLGGPNFEREIAEATERVRIMRLETEAMRDAWAAIGDVTRRLNDVTLTERRRLQLDGVSGPERVRLEEQIAQEDLVARIQEQEAAVFQALKQRTERLRQALAEEKIDDEQFAIAEQQNQRARIDALRQIEQAGTEALIAQRRAAHERMRREEERFALERAAQLDDLAGQIADTRSRLDLDAFAFQAEAIRRHFRTQIMRAERDGDQERSRLLQELHDLRVEEIRRREQERFEVQRQALAQNLRRLQQDMHRGDLQGQNGSSLAVRLFEIDVRTERETDRLAERLIHLRDQHAALTRNLTSENIGEALDLHRQIRLVERMIEAQQRLGEQLKANARDDQQRRHARQVQDVDARIEQLRFELGGRRDLARIAAIEHDFQRRINDAVEDGNHALADRLAILRELELRQLGAGGTFRQIDIRELTRTPQVPGAIDEAGNGEERQRTRIAQLTLDEMRAVRDAIERGIPAIAR